MSTSLEALRRSNPRSRDGFDESVVAAETAVRARIDEASPAYRVRRRRLVPLSIGGAVAAGFAVAAFLALGATWRTPGVENATAALRKAANVSAASAEESGTAVVRITHDGELWAARTIRWHGGDLALANAARAGAQNAGDQMLLVAGTMYGVEEGEWVELGPPESIDPGSGTTPAEYLAAVREDAGGTTLRRITAAAKRLTTTERQDGSIVYTGSVAAAVIARTTGSKEGQRLRLLPFGYVAHDEAADPTALLHVAVTVGADALVQELAVTWGGASRWSYTVRYSGLGTTPAPVAPADARPLRERLRSP